MKYWLILSSLTLGFLHSSAQKNFQKGNISFNNGTTDKGWIDYRNWSLNPDYIDFKKDSASEISKRFYTSDLLSFEISGKDAYRKAIVSKDMRPMKEGRLYDRYKKVQVTDTAFLRILVKSEGISLFELVDEKAHYFITEENGEMTELEYKVYKDDGDNRMVKVETYKDHLKALALKKNSSQNLIGKISAVRYKASDLTQIISALNGKSNNISFVAAAPRMKTQFFAGVGGHYSKIGFRGSDNLKNVKFASNPAPTITLGVDLFSERSTQAYILRFEVSYRKINYTGTGYREYNAAGFKEDVNYEISQNTISPGFDFLYKIRNSEKLSIYLGAGGAYNLSTYPENKYVTYNSLSERRTEQHDYINFKKGWVSGKIQTGVIVQNTIEVNAAFHPVGSFVDNTGFDLSHTAYALNAAYRF